MARPRKNGMDYFPHDTDARNDLKIRKLRAVFGNDGYATYFILLENIYRTKEYKIDVSDAETLLILADECKLSEETFVKVLEKCISLGLFDKEQYFNHNCITSEAIIERTKPIENKRLNNKKYYEELKENDEVSDAETDISDAEIKVSDAEIPPEIPPETVVSDTISDSESTQSKGKKRKENNKVNIKENNNIYMSDSDEYRLAVYLFNYIKANNPSAKEPNLNSWAKQFNYMLRIDKRPLEDVKAVITFSQKDSFWLTNILSPTKLREKYDQLMVRMKNPVKPQEKANNFNNFEQRTYDYDNLERRLLGWDK